MSLPLSPGGRRYGAFPSKDDPRDIPFTLPASAPGWINPFAWLKSLFVHKDQIVGKYVTADKVDLEPWCGPVKDQGDLSACTGFTYAGYMELLIRKFYNELPANTREQFPDPKKVILSPLFAYWWNRRNDGWIEVNNARTLPLDEMLTYINEDRGATMRAGMHTLRWQGICVEKEHPYQPRNFQTKPETSDCEQALLFRGGAYHRLLSLDDIRSALHLGYPVALAIDIYESFEQPRVARTGLVPVPNSKSEKLCGGHAVLCIGVDEKKRTLKVRNSWGDNWGQDGNFILPFAFIPYISEAWMCHFGPKW